MMIVLTALSLPFMTREPISLPPIVSVELIQITDKTNIPFAPKARKIIDKVKKEEKKQEQKQIKNNRITDQQTHTHIKTKRQQLSLENRWSYSNRPSGVEPSDLEC